MGVKGIDVSSWQGKIDWSKVKNSGIEFAIIRAGCGQNTIDKYSSENIENAIKQGIDMGVYWYIYAKNLEEVKNNAKKCIEVISPYKSNITMKVWADWEYDSDRYAPGLTNAERTLYVKAFCEEVARAGFEPGIYANPDYIKNKFDNITGYPLWLAWYGVLEDTANQYKPWCFQHSSTGKVDGIDGNVDLDIWYGAIKKDSMPQNTTNTTQNATVLEWQKAAIADGFNFPKYGADGKWGNECESVAKNAIVKKRSTYKYPNLTKIVQKAIGAKIDGKFGVDSWSKTMEYQRTKGLTVDGCVGIDTWKKILNI